MTYDTILYASDGPVATITLNRPEQLNTIVPPMPDEVEHAVDRATHDAAVKVIVLRGAGRAFCAGYDFGGGFNLANIPASQLAAMKLVVNQAYENMGLAATQTLGPILDGLMRNTPDALAFIDRAITPEAPN
jgi:1,4-dihydroxy-2-naphthoyl-CoA synthase